MIDTDAERQLDLVVWGATGFTGRLVAEYLATQTLAPPLRWGIAGRRREALETLRSDLGLPELPVFVGDSMDRASLDAICALTKVVLSTVGPFARYGSDLVAACAASGTHYCDITGEPQWIRRMLDAHQSTAEESGARIVHCCGFDSIPSDLGTWFLQEQALERFGEPCAQVALVVAAAKGGISGGTAASMLQAIEEVRGNRETRRVLGNPYALNPTEPGFRGPDRNDPMSPQHDPAYGWTGPFVMAGINTRIVRRTNALLGFRYGRDFRYSEAMKTGRGIKGRAKAWGISLGMGAFMGAAAMGPTRALLKRFVLPESGEGPDAQARAEGYFNMQLYGKGAKGALVVEVRGAGDPGYGATSRMLSESAICLARDELSVGGGIWTPASAMATRLIARLRERDFSFEVKE